MSVLHLDGWIDLSAIEGKLAAYPPTLRNRAINAIRLLGVRVKKIVYYAAPGISWLTIEKEDIFSITFRAFADTLVIDDICMSITPLAGKPEAFVIQRNGSTRAVRFRGEGAGPSAAWTPEDGNFHRSPTLALSLDVGPADDQHGPCGF